MSDSQPAAEEQLAVIEWHWLRPHLERDALILVAPDLSLEEAAARIAADDTATVGGWIAEGRLVKPTAAQIEAWNGDPARPFATLIVQPFVLAREINPSSGE